MKELTPEQIHENWVKLINLIKDTFPEDYPNNRREKLLNMYQYFEDRMCIAPASGKEHYHNAHVGGYVEHVLHVIDCSVQLKEIWVKNGATINFTDEELIFAAMHHDLGKVGDMKKDYYIPQDSDWHRKNQGSIFKHNGDLQFMTVTDRTIYLLNQFGITMTECEYVGLRLTDGLYEEANKNYYVSYIPERQLKSNIAYILHQADSMATHIEYDMWKRGDHEAVIVNQTSPKATESEKEEKLEKSKRAHDLFKELFDE